MARLALPRRLAPPPPPRRPQVQRSDDTEEKAVNRLRTYHANVDAVIGYYKQQLVEVRRCAAVQLLGPVAEKHPLGWAGAPCGRGAAGGSCGSLGGAPSPPPCLVPAADRRHQVNGRGVCFD